jgi:hypothetical protein
MLINFVQNVGFIGNLDEIVIKNNEINSNFVNGIKQIDCVNHKANLKFSDDFKNKMNDFELPKESEKITIDGSKTLVDGYARYLAAVALGIRSVQVIQKF